MNKDISPNFKWNPIDASIAKKLLSLEKTPLAVEYFSKKCDKLTDYGYWFLLSTLWVSYSGWLDLSVWKKLFAADRPKKKKSIMKPSEIKAYEHLPWFVTAYRAHREDETDWIAYTLDKDTAIRFAKERGVNSIEEYKVKKKDITALFLRRGEQEIIVLDKNKVEPVRTHIILNPGFTGELGKVKINGKKADDNIKNITMTPWEPEDKGYICLPLKSNIEKGHEDWKITECPVCGRECWESDLARKAKSYGNMIGVCTECALKAGSNNG